ncbi:hypothetical protein [Parasitella parasitica]|uniref:Uncharacterized protein n=1 Tax=Parasitella parasitica TaxID=35722 RepID=A0A0B7NH67_9FUNG|nr:hypothetical protein [Parasitella parasitica]
MASVYKLCHLQEVPIAQQLIILEFFSSKKRNDVRIPTKNQLTTWDTDILTAYVKNEWQDNSTISLYDLQLKTIILLCLSTMARPRSDVGRLQHRDVQFEFQEQNPISVWIHFREPKETQVKTSTLGLMNDQDICVVSALYQFLQRSQSIRTNLPEDHTLFLAYIN